MLDLNDLRNFAAVVEYGSFAAAARKLGLQKSTLSRRIASLEKALGKSLFDRSARQIDLTEFGKAVHDRCLRLVGEAQRLEDFATAEVADPARPPVTPQSDADGQAAQPILNGWQHFERSARRQDVVQLYILQSIRQKLFSPGDKLPAERDMAASLGVARQSVREAIRSLEMSGVLRLERGAHGGAFIREVGPDGIVYAIRNMLILGRLPLQDLLELRASIFGQSVRLAARHGTDEDFRLLELNVQQLEIIRTTGEMIDCIRPSTEFYRIAARASGNRLLAILVNAITDIIEEILAVLRTWPFAIEGEIARREAIRAMRAGDGVSAAAIVQAHCEETDRVLFDFAARADTVKAP